MSRLRAHLTNPKKQVIAIGAALLIAAMFLFFRVGSSTKTPPQVSAAPSRPSAVAIPTAAPSSPPMLSPPVPPVVPEPSARPAGNEPATEQVKDLPHGVPDRHRLSGAGGSTGSKLAKGHSRNVDGAATARAAGPRRPEWVDPFNQDDGSPNAQSRRKAAETHSTGKVQQAKPKQDEDTKSPPKPKRRLIEDL